MKARQAFDDWIKRTYEQKMEEFSGCAQLLQAHKESILNYFHNRATNASTESFNAKIKGFRPLARGVSDQTFFLFRLTKLFA